MEEFSVLISHSESYNFGLLTKSRVSLFLGLFEKICHFAFNINKMHISRVGVYLLLGYKKVIFRLDHRCLFIFLEVLLIVTLYVLEFRDDLIAFRTLDGVVPNVLKCLGEILPFPPVFEKFEQLGPSLLLEEVD